MFQWILLFVNINVNVCRWISEPNEQSKYIRTSNSSISLIFAYFCMAVYQTFKQKNILKDHYFRGSSSK